MSEKAGQRMVDQDYQRSYSARSKQNKTRSRPRTVRAEEHRPSLWPEPGWQQATGKSDEWEDGEVSGPEPGAAASALHAAAAAGNVARIRQLLLEGGKGRERALLGRRDAFGQTPLHCAVRGRHARAVRLLLQAGAPLEARMHTR